jgi:hypothetical protein
LQFLSYGLTDSARSPPLSVQQREAARSKREIHPVM